MLRAAFLASLFVGIFFVSSSMPAGAVANPAPFSILRGNLTVQQIVLGNGAAVRGDGNLHVDGVLRLANATGILVVDGKRLTLKSQGVEILGGNLSLRISASNIIPPVNGAVKVELPSVGIDGTATRVLIDGLDVRGQVAVPRGPTLGWRAPWLASGAVALLGFAATTIVAARARNRDQYGLDAWIQGDPVRALARAEVHLRKNPLGRDANVIKGAALFRLGKTEAAVAFLRRQRGHVQDANGLLETLLCAGLLNAGREAEALEELKAAVAANPRLAAEITGTELAALLETQSSSNPKGEAATGYV